MKWQNSPSLFSIAGTFQEFMVCFVDGSTDLTSFCKPRAILTIAGFLSSRCRASVVATRGAALGAEGSAYLDFISTSSFKRPDCRNPRAVTQE